MVSKEFFEFISAHCGNVVAWLLILWPFVHLALLIQTFSRTVFNEVLWLIDMGLGGKGQWITAIKITCIKLYLHLLIYSIDILPGDSWRINIAAAPSDFYSMGAQWVCSNSAVVSLSGSDTSGVTITAVSTGSATVTVYSRSTGQSASCTVNVN